MTISQVTDKTVKIKQKQKNIYTFNRKSLETL